MILSTTILVLAVALAVEMLTGYPGRLFGAIRHPVVWMGALISMLDRRLNRESDRFEDRRRAGIIALLILLVVTGTISGFVELLCLLLPLGPVLLGILASSLIASKSLEEHVAAVAIGLRSDGLPGGRAAVSMIVGRNPDTLDYHGVCRAAIESLAENFSDGVVAPAVWLGTLGLPGAALYKAINTADSMIGHRTPRFEAFGWASARLDDLVNWPASRLSVALIVVAAWLLPGADPVAAIAAVRADAHRHRSPNAGWPEAAFAGALGLKLNGPKVYGDRFTSDAYMGSGRAEATEGDILRALNLFKLACLVQLGLVWIIAGALLALR